MAKIKKTHQAHGKEETFEPTTLAQIWGESASDKYSTGDEDKYLKELNDLNKSDLQAHAVKIGIIPVDSREMLTKRLVSEFRRHVASYRKPSAAKKIKPKKISKLAQKILSEGR